MATIKHFENRKKAFSLLELIFAIVIIGVIASVAIPKLMNTKNDAMVSTVKTDVVTIISSIQTQYALNSSLDKISDAITLNSTLWSIEDKSVTFNDNEKECIKITILDDEEKLELEINEDASTLCEKLFDKGIISTTYELY